MNEIHQLLFAHRSIRKYTEQPIDESLLHTLVRAGQSAASSSFLQGATVIRVRDPERRERLAVHGVVQCLALLK